MKKKSILFIALTFSGILLFLSLINFKNPVSVPGNIEDNYFTLAVGIDKASEKNNNFKVTIIAESFSGNNEKVSSTQGKQANIRSMEGKTIFDAIRKFGLSKSKSLFWGHIKYILVSEEIAKDNVLKVLDFFIRDQELRFDTTVVIVKGMSSEAFLRAGDKTGKFIPDGLSGVFKNINKYSLSKEIKLSDLMESFSNSYSDVYIPSIELIDGEKKEVSVKSEKGSSSSQGGDGTQQGSSSSQVGDGSEKGSSSSQGGDGTQQVSSSSQGDVGTQQVTTSDEEIQSTYYMRLDGFAAFNGEKLQSFISYSMARGLNWVNSNIQSGIIVLGEDTDKKVSMEIIDANSETKIKINDNLPEATINIKFSTNIGEIMSQDLIFSEDGFKKLEEQQNEVVKKEAQSIIEYAQKNNIDILNVNDEIFHQYPLKWEKIKDNWKEIFKTMKITVNVESNINGTYHIKQSLEEKSGENK